MIKRGEKGKTRDGHLKAFSFLLPSLPRTFDDVMRVHKRTLDFDIHAGIVE
jgi:hypothetical protein